VNRSAIWPHLQDGTNVLTLYWGTPAQVDHDGIDPPAMPAGSRTISFAAVQPEIELGFVQNRDLATGATAIVYVFAKEAADQDRVFQLSAEPGGVVQLPPTLVLPAGTRFASCDAPIVGSGTVRILATSDAYPGDSFQSGLGIFDWRWCGPVGDGGWQPSPGSTPFARCVEGGESTPAGGGPSSPHQREVYCGPCVRAGTNPSDCDLGSSTGEVGFVCFTGCQPAFEFVCQHSPSRKRISVTKWRVVAEWREKDGFKVWIPGFGTYSDGERWCCLYLVRPPVAWDRPLGTVFPQDACGW